MFFDPKKRIKKHEFRPVPPSCHAVGLAKADKVAGISPYDGKSVHYLLFSYRQQIVDVFEIRA
jgi:hypothetical protein